ncbi:bifunctional diaminohydroxyphosphoribosylaminopyrimidine deaminase/5-amino-6-(5-phosphoribosylamino)uracil reductase RibD [Deinococcus ficus]|uniref:bifunctional diaminohydroxyphosphoribosylaminopyrimidine deaminase/5-amino-6-(5-phosphoribosylamino)uracil reductase RibD n=1 Tax=Deinococcus ficus TaxID=317577 RepID=UPI0006843C68|nr:bifunctional diaminohydroxyphosphoribosylaminopyrimidine deaminase/5-amino-6-(5-phosphoribosylamino)uracil reductase RibD [Deinococcus ficus]
MQTGSGPPERVEGPFACDAAFMTQALAEARTGMGRTSPNPPVGCVIVQDGEVVGRGAHPRAREAHAEVFALREAGVRARGATAFVTLEPCSHHGRTPPCADALIAAGVRRVVAAALDPNPRVAGRGVARLRAAGVDVQVGVGEAEALRQQAGFRSLVVRGRPWVVFKYAMTLDGRVAACGEGNGRVSGAEARRRVMMWRNELDAVAVGRGTVALDDPALTTRDLPGGRNARPVVFDRSGRAPVTAQVVRPGGVLVTAPGVAAASFEERGMTVLHADTLPDALSGLGALNVASVLLEGGPTLAGAFLAAGLVDEVRTFIAPKLLGAGLSPLTGPSRPMALAQELRDVTTEVVGPDLLITGFLNDIPRLDAGGRN